MKSVQDMFDANKKEAREQEIVKATQQDLNQTQSEFWKLDADLNQMMSRMNLGQRREFQDIAVKFFNKVVK